MRYILAVLSILSITASVAQTETKNSLDIETQGGYHYNYFKSPEIVRQGSTIFNQDSLISSSAYQMITADYDFKKKWRNNRLRISATPTVNYFYDNVDDSYWTLRVAAKFDTKITKTSKVLAELSLKRINREGLDGAQDILINPLGYTNYGASSGYEFQAMRNNETTTELFYNFKNFDNYGVRDLKFNEIGIQVKSVQKFKVNRLKHRYGVTAYIKKRLYKTFNASDQDMEGKRNWDYLKVDAFYELPLNKNLEIEPSFVWNKRIDNLLDRSGFTQYGPGFGVKFDNKKTKIRSSLSYITRDYKTIEARDTDGLLGEKTKYNYADFTLKIEHKINRSLFLTADVYSRIRNTNYTDIDARSFRGYKNQFAGIGLLYEL